MVFLGGEGPGTPESLDLCKLQSAAAANVRPFLPTVQGSVDVKLR